MTTYNTGNPIGSTDSRDRLDNTENMDYLENSTTELTHADRLGTVRKTRHGMEVEHDAQIAAHETEHDAQMQSFESDFDGRLAGMAFTRVGSFTTGATLTDMRQVLVWEVSQGGDGHEYGWTGTFPKVVAAGATPASSGGVGAGAWVDRTDDTLRTEFGYRCVVFSYLLNAYPDHNDAFEYALSTGRTIIIDRDMTLTRAIVKSENTPADIVCINDAKILGIDYAPRLRSNPGHRLSGTAKRSFYPDRPADTLHETMFSLDGIVTGKNDSTARRNFVTAYFGADSTDNSPYSRIWAINTLTNVHSDAKGSVTTGAGAEAYGYELDVNVDTNNTGSGSIAEGLRIAGIGDFTNWPLARAIHVMRDGAGLYKWPVGVLVQECVVGLKVENPTQYAAVFKGDKPVLFIPTMQQSNHLISIANPSNTQELFWVDDVGRTRVASLSVGGGSVATKKIKVNSPSVGFGDIPSGGSASKTFLELFGTLDIDLTSSAFNVTAFLSRGLPTGVFVDAYYNKANADGYVRVSNLSGSTFLNIGIDVIMEITQY